MSDDKPETKPEESAGKIPVNTFVISEMQKVCDALPPAGALCLIAEPIGDCLINGETMCRSTTAYCRDGAWIYADEPTIVRFDPVYWTPVLLKRKDNPCRWGEMLGKCTTTGGRPTKKERCDELSVAIVKYFRLTETHIVISQNNFHSFEEAFIDIINAQYDKALLELNV